MKKIIALISISLLGFFWGRSVFLKTELREFREKPNSSICGYFKIIPGAMNMDYSDCDQDQILAHIENGEIVSIGCAKRI